MTVSDLSMSNKSMTEHRVINYMYVYNLLLITEQLRDCMLLTLGGLHIYQCTGFHKHC